ncbi:MAG: hypothetical protein H8E37_04970 [Planctomycetes bacterium]|nr:hypothetical protein [Planctomycetota bacterium]
MDAIFQLYESILQLFVVLWDIVWSLAVVLLQYAPLIAWVAFWLLAVNWVKYREVLASGGWIGVVLIGFIMVLIWGLVAPPEGGYHNFLGLKPSNFYGKMIYVTGLYVIMFLCGSVQLSGAVRSLTRFHEDEEPVADAH